MSWATSQVPVSVRTRPTIFRSRSAVAAAVAGVGAVSHEVAAEVAADGARLGLERVGGAQHRADLVDGVGAFVEHGQALGLAGGGLVGGVGDVLGVHAGHVLDDPVELRQGVALGQAVGQRLGVGHGEGEAEGVVQALVDLLRHVALEPADELGLQRPVELLALGDGHVEQLDAHDPQAGEAEGVDDVAGPAAGAVEVVGLEHHQRHLDVGLVVLDPPGQHAAVADGVSRRTACRCSSLSWGSGQVMTAGSK